MGLVERHLLDAIVFAVPLMLTFVWPRLVPYLAVVAILLPSSATHLMTSEGLVLAGLAAGLAAHRLRRPGRTFGPVLTGPLLALAALQVLALVSLLANWGAAQGPVAAEATVYFVSRAVLVTAVVVLASALVTTRDWLLAIALGGALLALVRGLEVAGVPVQALGDPLSVPVLGSDFSTRNVHAFVLAVAAFATLAGAELARGHRFALALRALALLLFLAAGTTGSRTALGAGLVVLLGLALAAERWRARAQHAALAAGLLAASVLPAVSVLDKPLVVSTHAAAQPVPVSAAAAGAPAAGAPAADFQPPAGLTTTWRVLLDRTHYQLVQTFARPARLAHGNYVVLLARAAGRAPDVRLSVAVDGRMVAELSAADIGPRYRWVRLAVPDDALDGTGDVTVSIAAEGSLDSQTRYFAVAGIDALAPDVTSSAFSSGRPVPDDLSADPGRQRGMALVLLDGRVPPLQPLPASERQALDESVSDRLTLWRTAWAVFTRHPLLGTGFGTFGGSQAEDPDGSLFASYGNAHQNLLDMLSDLGGLGPVLLLLVQATALLALVGWPPRLRGPDAGWRLPLAGAVVVMLLMGLTQTWLADGRGALMAWVVLLVAGAAGPVRSRSGT